MRRLDYNVDLLALSLVTVPLSIALLHGFGAGKNLTVSLDLEGPHHLCERHRLLD